MLPKNVTASLSSACAAAGPATKAVAAIKRAAKIDHFPGIDITIRAGVEIGSPAREILWPGKSVVVQSLN
jgi:hypothetical protein